MWINTLAVVLDGKEGLNRRNNKEAQSIGPGGIRLKGEENSKKCPHF